MVKCATALVQQTTRKQPWWQQVTTLHEAETTVFFIIPCKTMGTENIIIGNEGADLSVEKGLSDQGRVLFSVNGALFPRLTHTI